MLRIPELRDENGRDLLNDDTSSDKSSPKVETEWMSDAIRAFDRVWHDPARREQSRCFYTGSGESSRTAVSQSRRTLAPDIYPTPYGTVILEQSHPYWHTTKQPYQLSHSTIPRFYSLDCLKEKLLGPENYKDWADRMKKNLERCGGLWITDADPEVSTHGSLNLHLWMMVFSNVSQSIQRELCALGELDARETWQFLEGTYGRDVPMKVRSVKAYVIS